MLVYARVLKKKKWDFTCPLESNGVHLLKWILLFHLVGGCCISFRWAVYLILEGGIMILHIRILYISCRVQLTSKIVATLQMHIYIDIYIYMYIYTYICIYMYIYRYTYTYPYTYTYTYCNINIYIYIYIVIYIYNIHIHIYIVHVYLYIYVCTAYIHVSKQKNGIQHLGTGKIEMFKKIK